MVKIFSGDDTDFRDDQRLALSFTAPDVDFTGCTAEVEFLGQKRTFANVASGARLSFAFSADETRGMACGVWPVVIRLRDANGRVRTVDNTQRIKVTDDVNEAYADAEQELAVAVIPSGGAAGVALPEIPVSLDAIANDSIANFKTKFNQLLTLLRSASACVAFLFALPLAAAPLYGPLNDIPGTTPIMTNVADYVAGELWTFQQKGVNAQQALGLSSWRISLGNSARYSFAWDADLCRWVSHWSSADLTGGEEVVPYFSDVTNIVRETQGTVWDDALGVAWQARMHNGHLYYIAVTNQPPEAN